MSLKKAKLALVFLLCIAFNANADNMLFSKFKCNAHLVNSCTHLSDIYQKGIGVDPDLKKAEYYTKLACDFGDKKSCTKLGLAAIDEKTLTGDLIEASSKFKRACDHQDERACYLLARIYSENYFLKNTTLSSNYYKKACDLDLAEGCLGLANLKPKDYDHKLFYFEKACSLKNTEACSELAKLYEVDSSKPSLKEKAFTLSSDVCDSTRDADACWQTAIAYEEGKLVKKDNLVSTNYFRKAADAYDMQCTTLLDRDSCYRLGMMYIKGRGMRVDYHMARVFITQSCELGNQDACIYKRDHLDRSRYN